MEPRRDLHPEDLRWLRALATRLLADPHLADDAVQETVVVALTSAPRLAEVRRGWLGSILRNVLRQEWRGRSRRAAREAACARPHAAAPSTLEIVEELGLHRRLVEHVHSLDEPYRTTIVLRFLHDRPVREIALALGLAPKSVHSRIERGLAKLRERLGPDRRAWAAFLTLRWPRAARGPRPLTAAASAKALALLGALVAAGALVRLHAPDARAGPEPSSGGRGEVATRTERAPADASALAGITDRQSLRVAVAPRPSGAPSPTRAVAGTVRALDGGAVAGATVVFERELPPALVGATGPGDFVRDPGAPRATSDRNGRFELALPFRPGRLTVESRDWACLRRPLLPERAAGEPVVVVAPSRAVDGRVVDEDGRALAGATVALTVAGHDGALWFHAVGGEPAAFLLPLAERRTDERGAFRFESVGSLAGLELVARRDGFDSAHVALAERERLDLELVLPRSDRHADALHGVVVGERGEPVEGALVSAGGAAVETDDLGRFALVEPGPATGRVWAVKPGRMPASADPGRGSPRPPCVLRLGDEPADIAGTVVDALGRPVPGAIVWTPDTTPFGTVVFPHGERSISGETSVEQLLAGAFVSWRGARETTADADGRFRLAGLLARPYAVFALDPRTLAGGGPVALPAGGDGVRFVLEPGALRPVAGRVVSRAGQPLAGARVTPGRRFAWTSADARVRETSRCSAELEVVTDGAGRFVLPPLALADALFHVHGTPLAEGAGRSIGLDAAALGAGSIELRVEAGARFQVLAPDPDEADRVALVDTSGAPRPLCLVVDGYTLAVPAAPLLDGRSPVLSSVEGEAELILFRGEREVRRSRRFLAPGGPHAIVP